MEDFEKIRYFSSKLSLKTEWIICRQIKLNCHKPQKICIKRALKELDIKDHELLNYNKLY